MEANNDSVAHDLDEPLGTIHEVALLLEYTNGRFPGLGFDLHAKSLARAHEQIEKWVLERMD
jgi:ATP phosphoribosyltransferase regulatory subunit HisZ